MIEDDITARADEIGRLIRDRLGCRGPTLAVQVRRAGRMLPRALAREARFLAQAAAIAGNPRLHRMIDRDHVDRAARSLRDHLLGVRPGDRIRTRILGIASVAVFNLMVLGGLILGLLVWQGYL